MNLRVVGAILGKDLRAFGRDRFYVLVSVLGLVFYVAVFWLLPSEVDETVALGIHMEDGGELIAAVTGEIDGFELVRFDSPADLQAAVEAAEPVVAGLDFPPGFAGAVAAGQRVTVRVLLNADAPEQLRPALTGFVRELAFALAGEQPAVTPPSFDEFVLGTDRSGAQVSLRERTRPLFVFFVLLVEMFALATLVAAEIHQRTVTALLVTPASVTDVLAAKAVLGTLLAFSQALLLLLATGSFTLAPGLLTVTLLLGALLVTGFGLLAGASGRDFVGIVFYSLLLLIPMAVPAVASMFPGTAAAWIRLLPTYGLVEVIVATTAYGEGWADASAQLAGLALWCVAAFGLGVLVLARRVTRI